MTPLSLSRALLVVALSVLGASRSAHAQSNVARSPPMVLPSLRGVLGMGAGVGVAPDEGVALVGGLTAGAKILFDVGRSNHFVLLPDLGFSSTQGYGPIDGTLWSAGLSPGFLWGTTGLAWAPRAIVGTRRDHALWGVRNGLRLYLIASVIDLEVAHQYTVDDQTSRHELIVSASLDVGFVAGALYAALSNHRAPAPPAARPVDAQIAR